MHVLPSHTAAGHHSAAQVKQQPQPAMRQQGGAGQGGAEQGGAGQGGAEQGGAPGRAPRVCRLRRRAVRHPLLELADAAVDQLVGGLRGRGEGGRDEG